MPRNAICHQATMTGPDAVACHTADIAQEAETLDGAPLLSPISGNGLMPRAYEVVNHASQIGIPPNLQVMLDDW